MAKKSVTAEPPIIRKATTKNVLSSWDEDDPVAAALERGRRAWKQYQANREYDKDAVYIYLAVIFDIVRRWKKIGMADRYPVRAIKRHRSPIRMKADPYARMIYCTSNIEDAKTRSKWAKVMRWVAKHNKKGRSFREFVKNNGGLNNCADCASAGFNPDWT